MFKNYGPFSYTFLIKWPDLTKGNLEYQQSLWRNFEISKFNFLKTVLATRFTVQVRCTILDAWGWCTGTTQRDGMGREEGGEFRMGNACIPVADSF